MTGPGNALRLVRLVIDPDYVTIKTEDQPDGTKLTETAMDLYLDGPDDIIMICVAVLSVNYADFFARMMTLISQARGRARAKA